MKKTACPERMLGFLTLLLGVLHLLQTYVYHFHTLNLLWWPEVVLLPMVVLLGIWCFFRKDRSQRVLLPESLCLIAITTLALISILMSLRYDGPVFWDYNRLMMIDIAVDLLVVFSLPLLLDSTSLWSVLMTAGKVIFAVVSAITLWLVVQVFMHQTVTMFGATVGMLNARNLTVVFHYNTVASFFATALIVVLFYMLSANHSWEKFLWGIASLANYLAMILTQSRTCILSFIGAAALLVFFAIIHASKPAKALHRTAIAVFAAVVCAVLLYASQKVILSLLSASWNAFGIDTSLTVRNYAMDDNVTGRFQLWAAALKAMVYSKHNFLFGTSPNGVISRITSIFLLSRGGYYTHNQFLEIGVAYGVPALIIYIAFMFLTARNCLRILLAEKDAVTFAERLVPVAILMTVIANMMEALLMAQITNTGVIFFLMCGWTAVRARKLSKADIQKIRQQFFG